MASNELPRVRTELQNLLISPFLTPHPVQTDTEFACHRHFGNARFPTKRQVQVSLSPVWIMAYRHLSCFHQQEAQQGIALLTDVPQPLLAGAGVLARNHSQVAADLLATRKPHRSSDDQHIGEG